MPKKNACDKIYIDGPGRAQQREMIIECCAYDAGIGTNGHITPFPLVQIVCGCPSSCSAISVKSSYRVKNARDEKRTVCGPFDLHQFCVGKSLSKRRVK